MKQNKETLKEYFETGDKPTQQQYSDLIDSYVDSKQPEGEANRRFVIDEKGEVSVALEKKDTVLQYQAGTNIIINNKNPLEPVINSISSIEGITSTGAIANNDNEIIIGNKPLGAYASFSYNEGNNLFGENNMVGGVNISTLDDQNNPVMQAKILHIGGTEPTILNMSSTANVQSFAKGGNTLKDYLFDFNFTEGFKIKKRIAGVVGNTNQAVIKATNLTTNINVEIPNESGILALTKDIPQIQAGTGITIDNADPLNPVINSRTEANTTIPIATSSNAGLMKANFYEEGTFIPVLTTSGATYTSNNVLGHYTRVGNMVTFNIYISNIDTINTPTGKLVVGNMPFLIFNSLDIDRPLLNAYTAGGNVPYDSLRTHTVGGNEFAFYKHTNGSTGSYTPYSNVTFTDGMLSLSGTYQTNII